jgi:hypothetical protein
LLLETAASRGDTIYDPWPYVLARHQIAPLNELRHRITLELIAEIGFALHGLLASMLGNKASTNLGPFSGSFAPHFGQRRCKSDSLKAAV